MGDGERPNISEIIIGTVDDYDSIETPMTQTLSFVPKEKFDKLENEYKELLGKYEILERKKIFFKGMANEYEHKHDLIRNKLREYETTIKTLTEVFYK